MLYSDHRGEVPVERFIESLPLPEQAQALRAVDLLHRYGLRLTMPHARHVEGALWELRAGPIRLLYSSHEHRFVLLHGYRKRSQKAPRREIDIAFRRLQDYLES